MDINRVLFVCIHNSARSQMAEAFLNSLGNGRFLAKSAGIEPGRLNPYVVKVMNEIGIDISGNRTTGVDALIDAGTRFDYVITVCDETSAERCPIFPTGGIRLHWGFNDPSALKGSDDEIMRGTRIIRDQINNKIREWIREI